MLINDHEYMTVVADIKSRISDARHRALMAANEELIQLYWHIGSILNAHKEWGNKFIQNLAQDIRTELPTATGYSVRNLKYMAQFAATYPDGIGQQAVAQLPWGHNIALMAQVSDPSQRAWYAGQAVEHGWSRAILVVQIETQLYQRQVTAQKVTNFETRLLPPQSDLAVQALKDPYIFDFIDAQSELKERDMERQMVSNISRLLLELGTGFAFVGEQFHFELDGQDFYIDLLFYHLKLHSYVVIELKGTDFRPEFAGKISFYVTAVDGLIRGESDNPPPPTNLHPAIYLVAMISLGNKLLYS